MSIRPIPYAPAWRFSAAISSCERERLAVERDRQPALEADHDLDRLAARVSGSEVSRYGSSGGASHGSSRIPASIERPNRFSSIENGELLRDA